MKTRLLSALIFGVCLTHSIAQQLDSTQPAFRHISSRDSFFTGSYYVSGCEDPQGYMWFGARSGIVRFDGANMESLDEKFRLQNQRYKMVRSIIVDNDNMIWFTNSDAVYHVDPVTLDYKKYNFFYPDSAFARAPDLEMLLQDRQGRLWVTGRYGLYFYDPDEDKFSNYVYRDDPDYPGNGVIYIAQDSQDDDIFWLATNLGGLQRFDAKSGEFYQYLLSNQENLRGYPAYVDVVWTVYSDSDGSIWLFTAISNNIIHFVPETGEWSVFPLHSNMRLHPDRVECGYAIARKSDNEFWISTNGGIGIFNKHSGQFSMFKMVPPDSNGLLTGFNRMFIQDHFGRLWLPQNNGISWTVDPVLSQKPINDYSVTLGEIVITENNRHPDLLSAADSIHLFSGERTLSLQFILPNYITPGDVSYKYRFQGKSKSWNKVGSEGELVLDNITSGVHYVEYKAEVNNEQVGQSKILAISVEPLFWETTWFKLIAGIIAIVILWFFYRMRIQRIVLEEKIKTEYAKQLSEVQLKALRAQMNPHFLFNTLNSINHYILKNERTEASAYLSKFSRLMRQVLDNTQTRMLKLSDELAALKLYIELEQLRFDRSFDFELELDAQLDIEKILLPPLIIQPYAENAIWHGLMNKEERGTLKVSINRKGDLLQIRITDDGIGRQAASELQKGRTFNGNSIGSTLTQQRIDIVNRLYDIKAEVVTHDLVDAEGRPNGTEVCITLPLISGG